MSASIKHEDIRKGDRVRMISEYTSGMADPGSTTYELIERPVQLPTELGVYADKDGGLWSFQTNGYLALKSASAAGWFTADHMRQFAPFTLLRPVAEVAAEVLAEVRKTMSARQAFMANIDAHATKWATSQPHPYVVTNESGAPLGIDWQTQIETGLIKTEGMGR